MTLPSLRFDNKIPSYETAAIIARKVSGGNFPQHTSAMSAGYGAELIAHLKANNLVKVSQHRAFLGFDKWRSAYPEIPSYATYLANRRNSTTGIVVTSTCKPNVSFTAGLKMASIFNLTDEYHANFSSNSSTTLTAGSSTTQCQGQGSANTAGSSTALTPSSSTTQCQGQGYTNTASSSTDPTASTTSIKFWDWIKQYPQISIKVCHQIVRDPPITEWVDVERECIEESGISHSIFALNTQHITNNDAVQAHWDTDEFELFPVQTALHIPRSRGYESSDGLTWNRQKSINILFGKSHSFRGNTNV